GIRGLALEEEQRAAVHVERVPARGRVDHHDAEGDEADRCADQDALGQRDGPPLLCHQAASSSTSARNWSPRSSKSRNWSNEAQAGDSSTVSPLSASAAAAPTARSSVSHSATAMCGDKSEANNSPASPMV